MLLDPPLRPGDVVILKKPHPCGSREWTVLMAGADIRLRCNGCGRVLLMDRLKFSSKFKKRLVPANSTR
ncbi:MAG TPA: DUF951 domain-containing protein [Firmicutes bacterium]|nr:DUF951 domain-containing protein [Candidatus Fermentithermobacillaceae bacterium]